MLNFINKKPFFKKIKFSRWAGKNAKPCRADQFPPKFLGFENSRIKPQSSPSVLTLES